MRCAKAGKALAKLVPLHPRRRRRKLGIAAGEFAVPDDFNAPLPDDALGRFYEGSIAPKPSREEKDL